MDKLTYYCSCSSCKYNPGRNGEHVPCEHPVKSEHPPYGTITRMTVSRCDLKEEK